MAVVTLRDEEGMEITLRQEDQMLYQREIKEGDEVILDEEKKLQKVPDGLSILVLHLLKSLSRKSRLRRSEALSTTKTDSGDGYVFSGKL